MPSAMITNPNGAFGTTDLVEKFGNGGVIMEHVATADIPARTAVTITTACKVTKATTGAAAAGLSYGVTIDAIPAGSVGKVMILGLIDSVPADEAIAAGSPVIASTTTAGSVIAKAAPTTREALGYAVAAASGGLVTIMVVPNVGGIT